jgi:DNA-binding transcriptional MerR regulator
MEPTRLIGISEAARRLGVRPANLRYHLTSGTVADVSLRTPSNGRVFSESDLRRIATALRLELREGDHHE